MRSTTRRSRSPIGFRANDSARLQGKQLSAQRECEGLTPCVANECGSRRWRSLHDVSAGLHGRTYRDKLSRPRQLVRSRSSLH